MRCRAKREKEEKGKRKKEKRKEQKNGYISRVFISSAGQRIDKRETIGFCVRKRARNTGDNLVRVPLFTG